MSSDFQVRQEEDRVDRSRLVGIAAGATAIGVLGVLVSAALLRTWGADMPRRPHPAPATPPQIATVEQTLVNATDRGHALRQRQAEALRQWRWVDRDAGIAEIPIDVAIDLTVAKEKK